MTDISVIIPKSRESDLTKEWCLKQLGGFNHEVIVSPTWRDGLKRAKGEFVTMLEKDCVLGPNYFVTLMRVFRSNSSFRKLAVVAPAVGVESWTKKIYGYKLKSNYAVPLMAPASSDPHFVQIAYLPGAIIRRSALHQMSPGEKDLMLDSFNFSIYFWNSGNMVLLHPGVTYVSTDEELDMNYQINEPGNWDELTKMFRREMIGRELED